MPNIDIDTSAKNAKEWTEQQYQFMAWLALPKIARVPKTQQLFAKHISVDEATLWRWKNLPGFRDEVSRYAKDYMRDDVPDVLSTIRQLAKKGSVAHLNMFLAMTGLAEDVAAAGRGPGEVKAYTIVSPDEWPAPK